MSFISLKNGDIGENVRELNEMLHSLAYPAEASGDTYNIRTKSAVMAFQSDNNLTVTGTVEGQTWELLKNSYKSILQKNINIEKIEINTDIKINEPAPETMKMDEPPAIEVMKTNHEPMIFPQFIEKSVSNDNVLSREISSSLAILGYYLPSVTTDYNSGIKKAIMEFQTEHSINPTGKADEDTIFMLSKLSQQYINDISKITIIE